MSSKQTKKLMMAGTSWQSHDPSEAQTPSGLFPDDSPTNNPI
jgi:hypothetical protein